MALFAVFAILVAAYSAVRMRQIDDSYRALISHDEQAPLALARANRLLQIARADIAELTMAGGGAANQKATSELGAARADFERNMALAAASADQSGAAIQALKARGIGVLDVDCKRALELGSAGEAGAQASFLSECSPKLSGFVADMVSVTEEVNRGIREAEETLTDATSRTITMTLALIVGGLVLVMAGGLLAVRGWISAPLAALSGRNGPPLRR